MISLSNLGIAWRALVSSKVFIVATNDKKCTKEDLCRRAIISALAKLCNLGNIPKSRYDMIISVLYDPSVVMFSKDDSGTCYISYDCASDDDFTDLKQCKIE